MKLLTLCCSLMVLLGGCASMEYPVPSQSTINNNQIMTTTSGQGQIYVLSRDNNHYLCSLPHPDSSYDQKDGGSFELSLVSVKDKQVSDSEDSEEVELAGRTPAVLISRELFFRACEFSSNYQLTKEEAKALYMKTLDGVLSNWAIEAGRTTVQIGDSVSNKNSISNQEQQQTTTTTQNTSSSTNSSSGTSSY